MKRTRMDRLGPWLLAGAMALSLSTLAWAGDAPKSGTSPRGGAAKSSGAARQAKLKQPVLEGPAVIPASAAADSGPALVNLDATATPSAALTLPQLEQIARENNPLFAQAEARVEAARGRQIQAGLYPMNPHVGYDGTDIGEDGRAGKQGIKITQELIRREKRCLNQSVAARDVEVARALADAQALRTITTVRMLFYETLAAEQTRNRTRDLVKEIGEKGLRTAEQIAKDPTDVLQAKIELEQLRLLEATATNNFAASWKRLVAAIGLPQMEPPSSDAPSLDGTLEFQTPKIERDATLERIIAVSPEVQAATVGIERAGAALLRARVEPKPNVTIEAGTQYDVALRQQEASVGISIPLPIFNKNQGNIIAAEADLSRARRELDRVKLDLANRFASAFARYSNAAKQVEAYAKLKPLAEQAAFVARETGTDYVRILLAQQRLIRISLDHTRALSELRQSVLAFDGLLLTDGIGSATGGMSGTGSSGE